jgi:D-3-phosphoglycerate dehydrogenase / 2-oxoglutarate reductase
LAKKILIALGWVPPMNEDAKKLFSGVAQIHEVVPFVSEEKLINLTRNADAIMVAAPHITRRVIEGSPNLKMIVRLGTGIDNIDVQAATEKGILVTNLPGIFSENVGEHALLLMLAVSRKLILADRAAREGRWNEFHMEQRNELFEKTLGVIGFGGLGSSIAEKCTAAFKMKVLTNVNKHLKAELVQRVGATVTTLEDLLKRSDFVVLCLPLTEETKMSFGKREFEGMKSSAVLINISRGGILDENALYEALQTGKIAGAGLDVLAKEPPSLDNPLLKLDNVIFTPHCSGITEETSRRVSFLCAQAVIDYFEGKVPKPPVNLLNPEVIKKVRA